MKKTLILLAGYPGTGKTYLSNLIRERFPDIQVLSPDEIKEEYWDEYGFNNLDEKEVLIQKSWQTYYQEMEKLFKIESNVLSDYPFSEKQKPTIANLAEIYGYKIYTIRLVANLDVLFARQKLRDLDESRHLGHILTNYHKDTNIQHKQADNLLNYEEFIHRCTTRGYEKFSLGKLYELDVTDYSKIDYPLLLDKLK